MHSEHFAGLLHRFRISSMVIRPAFTPCHLCCNCPMREVPALLACVNLVGNFPCESTTAALVLVHRHWTKEQKNAAGECCLNHMLCVTHKHARGDEHTRSRTSKLTLQGVLLIPVVVVVVVVVGASSKWGQSETIDGRSSPGLPPPPGTHTRPSPLGKALGLLIPGN